MSLERELFQIIEETFKDKNLSGGDIEEGKKGKAGQAPSLSRRQTGAGESGKVWVEGGGVYVKDPVGEGKMPTITPCRGVNLIIDGVKRTERTIVHEGREVIVEAMCEEIPGEIKIVVSPDKLLAKLELKPQKIVKYEVIDQKPAEDLELQVISRVEEDYAITFQQINDQLEARGVVYGIKDEIIRNLVKEPKSGSFIVAAGDLPGDPVDERVEILFPRETESGPRLSSNEKVDFKNVRPVFSVEPGTVLAKKLPSTAGTPGRAVTGEEIKPAPPKAVRLKAGPGAEIMDSGNKVVAKISGRPVVEQYGNRWSFKVTPVLLIPGDVDLATGNIYFKGAVYVAGNVCEGMTVRATGNVEVRGMVTEAKIIAGGDVMINKNVISSLVRAGGARSYFKKLGPVLDELSVNLGEIMQATGIMMSHPMVKSGNIRYGQLVMIIVEKKFKQTPALVGEILNITGQADVEIPEEIAGLAHRLKNTLTGINLLKIKEPETLAGMIQEVNAVWSFIDRVAERKARMTLSYSHNSNIESTGDIMVTGQGCFNSTIISGGNVIVNGVIRGGMIIAEGNVVINEAGSELGSKTGVRVPEGSLVTINKAYEGVTIRIGKQMAEIKYPQSHLKAGLDAEGRVQLDSF